MSRRTGSKAAVPRHGEKSVAQLQMEVKALEKALEDRQLLSLDMLEDRGVTEIAGYGASEAGTPRDSLHEVRQLSRRNAFLRDELIPLVEMERRYASDPRVIDKHNEIRVVQMQIEKAEQDVETLQMMRKRRNKGLRAIGDREEKARRMRGKQEELNSELRIEARRLTEVLRDLQKKDLEVRERCAKLKDQIKLSLTDADLQKLRQELERQSIEIEHLASKELALRREHFSIKDEEQQPIEKQRRECAELNDEFVRLQDLLYQKDLELKRTYTLLLRCGVRPDKLIRSTSEVRASGVMSDSSLFP